VSSSGASTRDRPPVSRVVRCATSSVVWHYGMAFRQLNDPK